jgi:hypothetical protein
MRWLGGTSQRCQPHIGRTKVPEQLSHWIRDDNVGRGREEEDIFPAPHFRQHDELSSFTIVLLTPAALTNGEFTGPERAPRVRRND